jgi:hypothetical protein
METRLLTLAEIESWVQPRFQRPIRMNPKVMAFCEELKRNGGMIAGVITLGQLPDDPNFYKVDGSHRLEAAKTSELPEFIADVRIKQYPTMEDMAKDFILLNDSLVRMRRDDILRGQEEVEPMLKLIREQCSFVGYDNIRRASYSSCMVSMSCALRCWSGSQGETPSLGGAIRGNPATNPENLSEPEAQNLCVFLNTAFAAWGQDPEYYKLWSNLNLTMCMWLFRQLVLNTPTSQKRHVTVNIPQFKNCLMSLSAATDYMEWLVGRNMTERDRTPCYSKLRPLFGKRLISDGVSPKRLRFPQPPWARSR